MSGTSAPLPPPITFIPCEPHFRPVLPTIEGPVDYLEFRAQILLFDELLTTSGAEKDFLQRSLAHWQRKLCDARQLELEASAEAETCPQRLGELCTTKQQVRFQEHSRRALRCNLARTLLGGSFREFSVRLADSSVLQWFCHIGELDRVKVPAKSTLQRYATWLPEAELRPVLEGLLRAAGAPLVEGVQVLGFDEPLDFDTLFLDTTCVKANIHYPTDWVLLRDGVLSLMQSVELIRRQGLKARMDEPKTFIKKINRLTLEMTHTRRKKDSRKERKRILRLMKKEVAIVRGHAQRYRALLDEHWAQTEWTRPQAEQVLRRLDTVLTQLPAAVAQAHERIIGERPVPNEKKILSLFEPDVQVLVRGKADAEVEFGNLLELGEQVDGLIVDWQLFKGRVPADASLVRPSVERVEKALARSIHCLVADRGFDSRANVQWLEERGLEAALCPRDPKALKEAFKDEKFARRQGRRAQTEARVAIFKNEFLGRPMRAEGFAHRSLQVAWGVFTHNLWVLARKLRGQRATRAAAKAAEALPQAA